MTTGTTLAAPATDLGRLRNAVRGPVIEPDDDGYDKARATWNGAIDRRPTCIARCAGGADVVAAVRFARERDLLVAETTHGGNRDSRLAVRPARRSCAAVRSEPNSG